MAVMQLMVFSCDSGNIQQGAIMRIATRGKKYTELALRTNIWERRKIKRGGENERFRTITLHEVKIDKTRDNDCKLETGR